MPRHWKTIYSSSRKRVMVRPGRHHARQLRPRPAGSDWSGSTFPVGEAIVAILGLLFALFVLSCVVELVIAYWPLIPIGFVLLVIICCTMG